MRKKFIVAIDNIDDVGVKVFTEYMKCYKCDWWHWLNNFWIIVDNSV